MNSRERLLAVLSGDIPDRVPISPFVQEDFLSYVFPQDKVDRITSAVKCAEHFDFDVMTRHRLFYDYPHFIKKSYANWEISKKSYRKDGNYYEVFTITTPDKSLEQIEARPDSRFLSSTMPTTTKYLIEDSSDLETFVKYLPPLDIETIEEMRQFTIWAKNQIGTRGLSAPWGLTVFNLAAKFRNLENILVDPYIDEEFYAIYMNKLTDICVAFDSALAEVNKDVLSFHGNIANSGLIGRDFFEAHILPYEKRVVDTIHDAGSFTLYHNCGKAEVLQKSYVKMGLSAWETIAEHPRGDNDLKSAKERVGADLVLVGNLDQVEFLKKASTNQIFEKVENMMNIAKPGGNYIFACSDYLEQDTPLENVQAMIDAAKRYGEY